MVKFSTQQTIDTRVGDIKGIHDVFFNEEKHEYTDEFGNKFNSVTTIISKYHEEFDTKKMARICAKIGKNPRHPKYQKYKGKTEKQLIKEWSDTTDISLDRGNDRHNYLEDTIKSVNNYSRVKNKFINDKIFTIPDILKNTKVGVIDIDILNKYDIVNKYPKIYNILYKLINKGWKLYAEIGVYNNELLVSGLVDLLAIKGSKFIIIDWKTNKSDIKFKSGYFEKDINNKITDKFIYTSKNMFYPIDNMPDSVGHKYSLQLSTYAYLIELFGFEHVGMILCHIKPEDSNDITNGKDDVNIININYYKNEVIKMLEHHYSNLKLNNEQKLFI